VNAAVRSVTRAWPAASDSALKGFAHDLVQPAAELFPGPETAGDILRPLAVGTVTPPV